MNQTTSTAYPKYLSIPAKLLSYIFHPLFIPSYVFLTVAFLIPYEFAGITSKGMQLKFFGMFWTTAFFPALVVFLLWRLKFISSIYLHEKKERIIPYITTTFFYWWMYYLSRNFTDQPEAFKAFYFGIFISASVALTLNNFFKISMHALGVGGALTFMIVLAFIYSMPIGIYISAAAIITGLVCTARFLVSDHTPLEIYAGLITGIICQLIGVWFVY
jgi:hypothetical protein